MTTGGGGPARILVADDEPSIRWLLERLLGQAGHAVTVAEDGAEALRQAAEMGAEHDGGEELAVGVLGLQRHGRLDEVGVDLDEPGVSQAALGLLRGGEVPRAGPVAEVLREP